MPEAVWNGFLRLSLVSCPVRLASAASDAHSIRLDQLNSRTGNPVATQFVDSRTGDVVGADAVVKGYQVAGSGFVTITDSELEALGSAPPNIIEVAHFAPQGQVDRARLDASYYIYPDGQLAPDTLEAVRLAMQRSGRDALAYVRLAAREQMVLIQVHGAGLLLSTLRPPRVMEPANFAERAASEVPADQIELAQSIIGLRTMQADANTMDDRYEERLRSLIQQKSGGSYVPPPQPSPAAAVAPPPPPPEPEPEPVAAAPPPPEPEPTPEAEPEGAVLSGEPEAAVAAAMSPEAEAAESAAASAAEAAAQTPETVPEGSILAGEPEPEPVGVAPPPEPEPTAAAPPPEPPPEPPPVVVDDEARARAERHLMESPPAPSGEEGRELGTEILLHIMGLGDRRFVEPGWAGHPGSRRQIEAMSIRPREELQPSAVEFRVFAQEGRATAWVSNGNYAGTRGRELPLTGFAVRPAPEMRDRFDIVYEGCFFDGGVVGPKRNGEICTSPVQNDPLEAVRISIVERAGA